MVSLGIARTVVGLSARVVLGLWLVVTGAFAWIHLVALPRMRAELVKSHPEWPTERIETALTGQANVFGIDFSAPLPIQYVDYFASVFQGDLGASMSQKPTVGTIVADSLPWTVLLLVGGTVIGFGFLMLYTRLQTWLTNREGGLSGRNGICVAMMPWYVLGLVLILVFGYELRLLPTGGRHSVFIDLWSLAGLIDILHYLVLPASTIGFGIVAFFGLAWSRQVEISLRDTATRRARVRGISNSVIRRRYVHRRTLDGWRWTGFTVTAWVLGYTVLLEEIFNYRALGWYTFEALQIRDYPLAIGCFIGLVLIALVAHALVDLVRSHYDGFEGAHLARFGESHEPR